MKVPIPTIALMLGLSYVTKYAGIDATLGVAFAATGVLYPFFAAMLGWLGVFLTGTDAGSNALFGSLQKITAGQVHDLVNGATQLNVYVSPGDYRLRLRLVDPQGRDLLPPNEATVRVARQEAL